MRGSVPAGQPAYPYHLRRGDRPAGCRPLDLAPVLDSVHKNSRLLTAREAVVPFDIGAEIAATVAREAFWDLDAPIRTSRRRADTPPYAPTLERA